MRFLRPERIVRLYPRAWRERYEDEMRALLEQTPPSSRVVWDLARGLGSEWAQALTLGATEWCRRESVRLTGLLFRRMAIGAAVGYSAAVAAWHLGSELHAAGYGLTRLSFVHEAIYIAGWFRTVLVAQSVINLGGPQWLLVRRPEAMLWGAAIFSALVNQRLEALYLAGLPWNSSFEPRGWAASWVPALLFSSLAVSMPAANALQQRRRALRSARRDDPASDGQPS